MSQRSLQPFIALPGADVPPDISSWLMGRGWYIADANGIAGWTSSSNPNYMNLSWEQAVAVEFFRFATLGGTDG